MIHAGPAEGTPTLLSLRGSVLAGVPLPLLAGTFDTGDIRLGAMPLQEGRCGGLRWCHDGQFLFGRLDLPEALAGTGALAAQVQQAYRELFHCLRETGFTHPLRLWNYLPHINADLGGLERYRHFNQGRQQAFIEAGQAAFEGAPAACALGTPGGPLCLRVLAGRRPVLPLENPRQVSAYHYPAAYGPRAPTFSRAALATIDEDRLLLLISGTASIVGHDTLHAGDARAQVDETLNNLQAIVDVANARTAAGFTLQGLCGTVYLRHAGHLETVRQALRQRLGADAPLVRDALYLNADICRHDLLVEIEAHAMRPGALPT